MVDNHYQKYGKKWYEENRDSELARGREYYTKVGKQKKLESYPERRRRILKSRYGITPERFNELFENQHGRCAICKETYHTTLHIDHNHSNGQIRGLLCNNCNRGLGHFKENPEYLKNAIEYISGHGGSCGV